MPQAGVTCVWAGACLVMGATIFLAARAASNRDKMMNLSTQDALIYMMVVTAAADTSLTDQEIARMSALIERLPVFAGYDLNSLPQVAENCAALMQSKGVEGVLKVIVDALPERFQDTAYALAVEIAAVDLQVEQIELRWLELVRDHLSLDRLTTAAIEVAARARLRRA